MASNKDIAQNQKKIFANNLNYYLNVRGKTQLDLANELDVTTSTVSDWYNAKKYPRVDKMQRIADYLGILISDLREEKRQENASATISEAEALRIFAEGKKGGPLTPDELSRLADFAETFIKGLNK